MYRLSITLDTPKWADKIFILDFDSYNKIYTIKKTIIKFPYWFKYYCKLELLEEQKD